MIDICIAVYKDYVLIEEQLKHWDNWMKGDFNLVISDNTPKEQRQYKPYTIPVDTDNSFDGISCGEATDFVVKQSKSDIVCTLHPDFFFFDPNILETIQEQFKQGYKIVGCQGFYPDFQTIIDSRNDDQHSSLSPVCWGCFWDRELVLSESFICEPPGVGKLCGYKHRSKIVKEQIPNLIWPGFYPFEDDHNICFFGDKEKPIGVHLLKGSGARLGEMPKAFNRVMDYGLSFYK